MRIAIVTPLRSLIREPLAGGLEGFCVALSRALQHRGHHVQLFGGFGSDPALGVTTSRRLPVPAAGRADVSNDPDLLVAEAGAYRRAIAQIAAGGFDVVHDNSMHHAPIISSSWLLPPVVTTLHTPPIARVEAAIRRTRRAPVHYVSVSRCTARGWSHVVSGGPVITNGVDLDQWQWGPGGGTPVWSGRIVEEKGVTQAIRAARLAGAGLRIAGRCQDYEYFKSEVRPLLGGDIEYLGHLPQYELAEIVRSSAVALVTPCWEEPYGLVAAEAIASGTPVAGFDRGALSEIIGADNGVLVRPGNPAQLAKAIHAASKLDRRAVRAAAATSCSLHQTADAYETLFRRLVAARLDLRGVASSA